MFWGWSTVLQSLVLSLKLVFLCRSGLQRLDFGCHTLWKKDNWHCSRLLGSIYLYLIEFRAALNVKCCEITLILTSLAVLQWSQWKSYFLSFNPRCSQHDTFYMERCLMYHLFRASLFDSHLRDFISDGVGLLFTDLNINFNKNIAQCEVKDCDFTFTFKIL